MPKDKEIGPIDANFDDVTETIIGRTTEDSISSFARLTQEEMANEANES